MTSPKITMTLLVRDEEDIIADVLQFHYGQGVSNFIVMDNLSTDRTPQILSSLAREMPVEVLHQRDDNYAQAEWVTQMALRAAAGGADWVIHSDADEFWMPAEGSISEYLGRIPQDVGVIEVIRHNAVVIRRGNEAAADASCHPRRNSVFEKISINNHNLPLPPKCIHRASATVKVAQGNHSVSDIPGQKITAGDGLAVLHFPYRSLQHYRRKITLGGAAYERNRNLTPDVGATWREHYRQIDKGVVDRFWSDLVLTRQEATIELLSGNFFRNERLAKALDGRAERAARLRDEHGLLCHQSRQAIDEYSAWMAGFIRQVERKGRPVRPMYYNLEFCVSGPARQAELIEALPVRDGPEKLCQAFSHLRDTFSLFPGNDHLRNFMARLLELSQPDDVARLKADCDNRQVVLHGTCQARMSRAEASAASFADLPDLHHILLVGEARTRAEDDTPLLFSYDGRVLRVPVPDNYESLHRKLFYAFTIIDLVTNPAYVVKVDDNIHLHDAEIFSDLMGKLAASGADYAGRKVGAALHMSQWHGWHLQKCDDPVIEARGYQYPLPRSYAAGGYGYILSKKGLAACSYMYLAMKEFFAMRVVGLEDALVGHAAFANEITLVDVSSEENLLTLPGLTSTEILR